MERRQERPDNPGGVPFYGMGRYCFALDYPAFDIKHLGQPTKEGRLLTKWYGGLAHELGHGLNLPHNHQTTSDGKKYGTALMGAGNYTFGTSPTFLTPAAAPCWTPARCFPSHPASNTTKANRKWKPRTFPSPSRGTRS